MFSSNKNLSYQFLPSALEVIETPPSPLSRVVLWLIVIIVTFFLGWAYLGRTDEVVVTRGKIVPSDGVFIVQAPIQGKIAKSFVQEGDDVEESQALFEYDASEIDLEIANYKQKMSILEAELKIAQGGAASGIDSSLIESFYKNFSLSKKSLNSQIQIDNQKIKQLQAQLQSEQSAFDSLSNDLSSAHEQQKILKASLQSGLINNPQEIIANLSRLEHRIQELEISVRNRSLKIGTLKHQIGEISAHSNYLKNSHEYSNSQRISELNKSLIELRQNLSKLQQAKENMTIRASRAGKITLINAKEQSTVAIGANLASVVPKEAQFQIEALVSDKDVSKIAINDEVKIKINSYSYQRYGVLVGKILNISADAIVDNERGVFYQVRVAVDNLTTNVGKVLKLNSGMGATVEIKAGDKRIMDFFIEPLLQKVEDGFKSS